MICQCTRSLLKASSPNNKVPFQINIYQHENVIYRYKYMPETQYGQKKNNNNFHHKYSFCI